MAAYGLIFGSFVVEGLPELLADIDRYGNEIKARVSAELRAAAQTIVRDAAKKAPVNMSGLRRGISYKEVDEMNFLIVSSADYSSFVEFGTKRKVSIPPGLENFAQQFHGIKQLKGGRLTFEQAIYKWAKKKGIPKKYWRAIFISIAIRGIRAQPFFFPAVLSEGENLVRRIQNVLNTAV